MGHDEIHAADGTKYHLLIFQTIQCVRRSSHKQLWILFAGTDWCTRARKGCKGESPSRELATCPLPILTMWHVIWQASNRKSDRVQDVKTEASRKLPAEDEVNMPVFILSCTWQLCDWISWEFNGTLSSFSLSLSLLLDLHDYAWLFAFLTFFLVFAERARESAINTN